MNAWSCHDSTTALARWALALVDPSMREFVTGDLEELYRRRQPPRNGAQVPHHIAAFLFVVGQAIVAAVQNPRRISRQRQAPQGDGFMRSYFERLFTQLESLPGVGHVAAADRLPVLGGESVVEVSIDGQPPARPADQPCGARAVVTPQFFPAAGIPIVAGRGFASGDDERARRVAVVNSEMARRYWGGAEQALGKRMRPRQSDAGWLDVVGVSGDVQRADLRGVNPHYYVPLEQYPARGMSIMIRAAEPEFAHRIGPRRSPGARC